MECNTPALTDINRETPRDDANSTIMQEAGNPMSTWKLGEKSFEPDPIKCFRSIKAKSHLTTFINSLTPRTRLVC